MERTKDLTKDIDQVREIVAKYHGQLLETNDQGFRISLPTKAATRAFMRELNALTNVTLH